MRRLARFALLFLFVFAIALAVRLPLQWALPWLPESLHCERPEGTVWSGRCQGLSITPSDFSVSEVEWTLRPARLLRGRVALDVRARRGNAEAKGLVQWSPGRIEMLDLAGAGSLEPGLPPPLSGWSGHVRVESLRARLVGGRLDTLDGQIEARDLRSPQGLAWGSYRLDIPRASGPGIAPGRIASLDGPLILKGSVQLNAAQRSWQLDLRLAVQPGAAAEFGNALSTLPPPDPEGLRPLSIAGTF